MKKPKFTKESPAEFNNNPFKSLKSVKSAFGSTTSRKAPVPPRKEKKEDDADLFMRAVAGARAIHPDPETRAEEKKIRITAAACSEDRDEQQLFLQAMQKIGTKLREPQPDDDVEEAPRRFASGRMKQLKRGVIRIREELDLHGHIRDEALVKLEHFIASAYSRGRKAVLVITGKGINSPDGPVLQGAVAAWLREKGKGIVVEFAAAPRDMGGSGAFVVFLKAHD